MQISLGIREDLDRGLTPIEKAADKLMEPLMSLLQGEKGESQQETHMWHSLDLDPMLIPSEYLLCVENNQNPLSEIPIDRELSWLNSWRFHVPRLGGWKDYLVIGCEDRINWSWNIGWQVTSKKEELVYCQIHRKPIFHKQIKMLSGHPDYNVGFFGINSDGTFLHLGVWDSGVIGDLKYHDLRQF